MVFLLWEMPLRLLQVPPSETEMFGTAIKSLATAWAGVWLLGGWLSGRGRFETNFWVVVLILALASVAYLASFGGVSAEELPGVCIFFGVSALSLSLGITLSRFCCRSFFSRGRFMGWLALWMILVPMIALLTLPVVAALSGVGAGDVLALVLMGVVVGSFFMGGVLYLINVPFMILAFKSPFYRQRFENVVRMEEVGLTAPCTSDRGLDADPLSMEPTTGPISLEDVVGRWQFYLDDLSRTVMVDLYADSTFAQTIAANQGGVIECPGGKWRLEGSMIHLTDYVTARQGTSESRTWWMIETSSGPALFGGDGSDSESFFRMTRARA